MGFVVKFRYLQCYTPRIRYHSILPRVLNLPTEQLYPIVAQYGCYALTAIAGQRPRGVTIGDSTKKIKSEKK